VAGIEQVDRTDNITYVLRLHRGPLEYFPMVCEEVAGRLSRDGCYLVRDAGAVPVRLSPMVFAAPCELCCRSEVMLADTLDLDARAPRRSGGDHPEAVAIRGFGAITMHPGVYRPAGALGGPVSGRGQTLSGLRNLSLTPGGF
jgi:hypothetical protein